MLYIYIADYLILIYIYIYIYNIYIYIYNIPLYIYIYIYILFDILLDKSCCGQLPTERTSEKTAQQKGKGAVSIGQRCTCTYRPCELLHDTIVSALVKNTIAALAEGKLPPNMPYLQL